MSRGGYRWDNRITLERAQDDVEDFEFLLSQGETYETACRRLGMHAQTIKRRYQQIQKQPPPGLSTTVTRMRQPKKQKASQ